MTESVSRKLSKFPKRISTYVGVIYTKRKFYLMAYLRFFPHRRELWAHLGVNFLTFMLFKMLLELYFCVFFRLFYSATAKMQVCRLDDINERINS